MDIECNADDRIRALSERVGCALEASGQRLVTVESCSGGWIAKALTDVPGSSQWFTHGIVTYSNESKQALAGVSAETLRQHGAVSRATVREMARGGLTGAGADEDPPATVAVAVTGVAGPDGGSPDKPVGTVWLAWAWRGAERIVVRERRVLFPGDRDEVRRGTVIEALRGLLNA